jgi:hypothetical protein
MKVTIAIFLLTQDWITRAAFSRRFIFVCKTISGEHSHRQHKFNPRDKNLLMTKEVWRRFFLELYFETIKVAHFEEQKEKKTNKEQIE